jgi:hypothetical protein
VVKSGDPVEQEKQLKYASLVANTIMLSNVADLTGVLADMARDGRLVTPALAAGLSPYARKHILRFGKYALNMDYLPDPLDPQPLPFERNCSTPPHSVKLLRKKGFSACRNRPEWEARKCDIGSRERDSDENCSPSKSLLYMTSRLDEHLDHVAAV